MRPLTLLVLLTVVGGAITLGGCASEDVNRTVPKAAGEKHQDEKEKRDGHYSRGKG